MNKIKLKWKIFVIILGFCALLLIILWIFQTIFLEAFYKHIKVLEIKRDADIIANNAGDDGIEEIIAEISKNSEITIDITALNGASLLTSFEAQDRRIVDENAAFISQAQEKGGEAFQYNELPPSPLMHDRGSVNRTLPPQTLVYVKLAEAGPDGPVAVIIRAMISPVDATVTTLRYQLYVISGIMLILSVVLAIFIAKRVSKPIEEITQSALTLAGGDYDTRFEGKGFHEIVTLSDTLNTAAVELGRVEGLRRELLANVSHDMRTPLSLIYSYAEMMNDFPDEITPSQTQVIMDETRRLTTLVNDVLDISKLEANMEQLNITCFNLTQSLVEITERIRELLKNEEVDIAFSYDSDVYVSADAIKIDRAFYNLLINAVNYSGDSREISVTQTVLGDVVRISIKDNGEGITEDDLPIIWDRYYKSGHKHKRAVTGTGLGLSIVKKIIEMHGGRYGVSSELGKGSTFWFEIGSKGVSQCSINNTAH